MTQIQEATLFSIKNGNKRKIKSAMTTTIIGSISTFEETIGKYLWGHGKKDSECSQAELSWRKVWKDCRDKILDKGNDNIRKLEKELDNV